MKLDRLLEEIANAEETDEEAAESEPTPQRQAALIAQELLEAHDELAKRAQQLRLHPLATSIRARRKAIEQELLERVQQAGGRG